MKDGSEIVPKTRLSAQFLAWTEPIKQLLLKDLIVALGVQGIPRN
jgi:hypothetical protein